MSTHLLTPEQAAIVRAGGTMLVIPGDPAWGEPDYTPPGRIETRPLIFVAPRAWLALTEPCDTCGGTGSIEGRNIASWDGCWDCVDGSKIIDLEEAVPCERGGDDIWAHVLVARATIQLLPVCQEPESGYHDPDVITVDLLGQNWNGHRRVTLDPLPVPGRDWVAVLTIIEPTP
jgi:hypothetical protein